MTGLWREVAASARAQPVPSILTILVIAGMVLAVMMTTGRTVAAEQQVLSSIDEAGTRTILIRADEAAGVRSDVLDRLQHVEGIQWAGAFSLALDGVNVLVPEGTRVGVRYLYTGELASLGIEDVPVMGRSAFASPRALESFGLVDAGGAILLASGEVASVSGVLRVPDYLRDFEPLVLIPATPTVPVGIGVLLVVADTPERVTPLADAVMSVLMPEDPTKITVQTSETLAQLRGLIQSQLGTSSRVLVLGVLSVTAILVAVILFGLVMMRRRDFGRRRALGATRGFIVALLLGQTALLALLGVLAGVLLAVAMALVLGDALPGAGFVVALGVLGLAAATMAAIVPAIVASRREPIRELRVP